jgi:glycolate oxidase iron-sulfur subunit
MLTAVAAPPGFKAEHPDLKVEYDNMLACVRCGLCLTSCPTYVLSLQEAEGPRGRVGMARALAEGHLQITPDVLQHEANCLVCDACSAVCPAGVHMDPLQVVLRAALEPKQRRKWHVRLLRKIVFEQLFTDMARFRLLVRLLWIYQKSGLRWLARSLGVLKLMRMQAMDDLLPSLPGSFVTPHSETYGTGSTNVAFFAGCVMSTALADIDKATIRVLTRAECTVSNPRQQGCCGALHAHGGDLPTALRLARANIEAFEQTDGPIVVNSAGCGAMLKDYAHHFRADPAWAERARAFSRRVKDVSEVLSGIQPTKPLNKRVVYQDACHLLHAQRISRQPRDLLRTIPELDLKEIAESGLCCGSAGIYNVTNPVESQQLQQRKLDNALAVDPEIIVTGNPGCLLQLQGGLKARGSKVEVKHLVELLDEATRP